MGGECEFETAAESDRGDGRDGGDGQGREGCERCSQVKEECVGPGEGSKTVSSILEREFRFSNFIGYAQLTPPA